MTDNTEKFEKDYSEEKYWTKLTNFAKKAGSGVVEKSLWLYFAG